MEASNFQLQIPFKTTERSYTLATKLFHVCIKLIESYQSPNFSSESQDMLPTLLITLLLLANEASVKAAPPPPSDVLCPADAEMYKECRASICSLIKAAPEKGPTLVRLAWHASATYTKMTNKGGSYNGTIRFSEEFSRGSNNGLQTAMGWLNEIWLYVRLLSLRHLAYNTDTSA